METGSMVPTPSLENDRLVFRFPDLHWLTCVSVSLIRTLRVPDTERTYPLPMGLGPFSLRHVHDFQDRLPPEIVNRGGVILPIWPAEAMWVHIDNTGPSWQSSSSPEVPTRADTYERLGECEYEGPDTASWGGTSGNGVPAAIQIATGKVNVITGKKWNPRLSV